MSKASTTNGGDRKGRRRRTKVNPCPSYSRSVDWDWLVEASVRKWGPVEVLGQERYGVKARVRGHEVVLVPWYLATVYVTPEAGWAVAWGLRGPVAVGCRPIPEPVLRDLGLRGVQMCHPAGPMALPEPYCPFCKHFRRCWLSQWARRLGVRL